MKNEQVTMAALAAALAGDIGNAVVASTPGGIEAQEAQGQKDFCASDVLPKDCPRQELERLGFKFGDDVDDIFVQAQFPGGWQKQATSHSMWSELIDNKGRRRAGIFYKAAFYDRSARMRLDRRYTINGYLECDAAGNPGKYPETTHLKTAIMDAGEPLHIVGLRRESEHQKGDEQEKEASTWLSENYPDHNDPLAYWD